MFYLHQLREIHRSLIQFTTQGVVAIESYIPFHVGEAVPRAGFAAEEFHLAFTTNPPGPIETRWPSPPRPLPSKACIRP